MTIPKRNKRRQKRGDNTPLPVNPRVEEIMKSLETPTMDKMVRNYPKRCPKCGTPTYSTQCTCGRLTVINK